MGNFDRDRGGRSSGGRGFERRSFNSPRFAGGASDRGSRGPVEMHQAVCDNCGKSCEVPFRPTSGKPIYCSSCFEHKGSDSKSGNFSSRGGQASEWEEKRMFDATCDECGKSCQVPFQPSSGKPIYCSNCFGEKKGTGSRDNGQSQNKNEFEQLNSKLDKILAILDPKTVEKAIVEEIIEEIPTEEVPIKAEIKAKISKKKAVVI